MSLADKINKMIEARRFESIKKQIGHKMSLIVKILGQEVAYVSGHSTQEDGNLLPTAQEWTEHVRGYYFDGLKFGVHLHIWGEVFDDKIVEITTKYNGYVVFQEIEGKTQAYAPFPEWEIQFENLYEMAKNKEKRVAPQRKADKIINSQKEAVGAIKILKQLWGY